MDFSLVIGVILGVYTIPGAIIFVAAFYYWDKEGDLPEFMVPIIAVYLVIGAILCTIGLVSLFS